MSLKLEEEDFLSQAAEGHSKMGNLAFGFKNGNYLDILGAFNRKTWWEYNLFSELD